MLVGRAHLLPAASGRATIVDQHASYTAAERTVQGLKFLRFGVMKLENYETLIQINELY